MRLAALPFGSLGFLVVVAQAAAQEPPGQVALDPVVAWVTANGPVGAAVVIAWRSIQLGSRLLDLLDRALVEVGRWRELAPGASWRIEHAHEGLDRLQFVLTDPPARRPEYQEPPR